MADDQDLVVRYDHEGEAGVAEPVDIAAQAIEPQGRAYLACHIASSVPSAVVVLWDADGEAHYIANSAAQLEGARKGEFQACALPISHWLGETIFGDGSEDGDARWYRVRLSTTILLEAEYLVQAPSEDDAVGWLKNNMHSPEVSESLHMQASESYDTWEGFTPWDVDDAEEAEDE